MLVVAFFLTFFFAAVCADNLAAGSSRFLGTDRKPETVFSLDKFVTTVGAIIDTIDQGDNRTYDHAIPVPKIYGVNVSLCFSTRSRRDEYLVAWTHAFCLLLLISWIVWIPDWRLACRGTMDVS